MKKYFLLIVVLIVGCAAEDATNGVVWRDFNDEKIRLAAYKPKWVIVNYWATWCAPCIKEMPTLQDYYQQSSGTVVVIGANIEHADGFVSPQAIVNFTKKLNLTFPIVKANIKLNRVSLGEIRGLPMTVIINPQGEIVYRHLGEITKETLNQYVH